MLTGIMVLCMLWYVLHVFSKPPIHAPPPGPVVPTWKVIVRSQRQTQVLVMTGATEGDVLKQLLQQRVDPRTILVIEPNEGTHAARR